MPQNDEAGERSTTTTTHDTTHDTTREGTDYDHPVPSGPDLRTTGPANWPWPLLIAVSSRLKR
jgi:hypothetical protein